jgi:hypothetical protein
MRCMGHENVCREQCTVYVEGGEGEFAVHMAQLCMNNIQLKEEKDTRTCAKNCVGGKLYKLN